MNCKKIIAVFELRHRRLNVCDISNYNFFEVCQKSFSVTVFKKLSIKFKILKFSSYYPTRSFSRERKVHFLLWEKRQFECKYCALGSRAIVHLDIFFLIEMHFMNKINKTRFKTLSKCHIKIYADVTL